MTNPANPRTPTPPTQLVRPWQPEVDLDRLVEVSRAADVMFADFGLSLPPDDPANELCQAEHVLVAGSPPLGFAVVNTVDRNAHLNTLAVHPEHGRQGIGGQLLAAACELATELGRPAMTLTTFVDVPWNAPWYRARGFAELRPGRWGTELWAVWTREETAGIVVAPRIAMIRDLNSGQTL